MILIVDDDVSIRSSLALMLKTAGFESRGASTEKEAFEILRSENPDLAILDMNLSLTTIGRDGIEILRKFKILRPLMPVILLTAWGTLQLAVEGMKHGASDFVTKPWSNRDFVEKIKKAMDKAEMERKAAEAVATIEDSERELVAKALNKCDGNLSAAASLLGISRQALYRRIEKYGIKVDYK